VVALPVPAGYNGVVALRAGTARLISAASATVTRATRSEPHRRDFENHERKGRRTIKKRQAQRCASHIPHVHTQ